MPTSCLDGLISLMYKKGHRLKCDFYRGTTIFNSAYKILLRILFNILPLESPLLAYTRMGDELGLLVKGWVNQNHKFSNILFNNALEAAFRKSGMHWNDTIITRSHAPRPLRAIHTNGSGPVPSWEPGRDSTGGGILREIHRVFFLGNFCRNSGRNI